MMAKFCSSGDFCENRCRRPPRDATRLSAVVRMRDVKKALAYLPAIPAVHGSLPHGEPAGLGISAFDELPKSGAPISLPGQTTDPEELVSSALAILAGHKPVATPALDLPRPQLPPLRADTTPANVGRQSTPNALPLQQRTLSDGSPCPLPIRYFDAQLLIGTYLVDYGRAAALLKNTGVIAVPQGIGQALVAFGCFQYRKTDIGPYNEVGLAILASAPKSPVPALYVVHLPVDTALANRAGHEIWGYNKFVASIDVADSGNNFSMAIRDPDNATIARFNGARTASVTMPPNDIVTFSIFDGQLMRTVIQMMTPSQLGAGSGFSLKIGGSAHPMADTLRTLGLDGLSPVLVQYADPFQSLLFPGQPA
jgi:Acetoacetate decarboxylase (ADC)